MKRQAPLGLPALSPEYVEYTNKSEILSITGTFFAAAALVVLLRCYVRLAMLKVFGLDDYVMVFAMILATATFACIKVETDYGLGKHFLVILADPTMFAKFGKVLYIHSIIVMVGVSAVKISIALFLMRLTTKKPYIRSLHGIIGFIILLTFTCAMTLILQCLPVQATWDATLRPPPFGTGDAKCYSSTIFRNLGLMNSSFNIITDALFALLPIPLIWKLQLNTRTKLSLIAILSLGWFACAAAIIKAIQQWNVIGDPDWTVHDSFNVWNFIEFTIGIIAASLPSLKPLFNWFLETARAITSGARSKAGSGYRAYDGPHAEGYHKQSDNSIALNSLSSRGIMTRSPYHVRISTEPSGLAEKDVWDMDHSKNSDESILPLARPDAGMNRIVMTREVRVS
ncbi:hypothetical protein BDV95DRAFT_485556 [Massariosphaeria phaeospora]|uniref:Rhodopsin domain-containing protein n=1 Tax=Massariosphaeria phaeospora TaxID=100035 RepID=A0A7C8MSL6_9PLEO|nr:hypothetical protein BDV95DRAFT_485556 [Massariosphaeria phaeospora]